VSLAAILWKDARRELRQKEAIQAGLVLVGLFLLLGLFAYASLEAQPAAAATLLWTPILFGTAALAARGFASEADLGTLDLVRTLPVPASTHGWSRTLVNLALLTVLVAFTVVLLAATFAAPVNPLLVATAALAVPGLAVVGTLAAAIAGQARNREMLVPLLMVPALAPLLHAGVEASLAAFSGAPWTEAKTPLLVLAGYDLLALGVASLLWPVLLEAE
jgi:heme exporter protein B